MGITAQALDSVYGRTAASVRVRLERNGDGAWHRIADSETDGEGCIHEWRERRFERGLYRIIFETDCYFVTLGLSAAYPEIGVLFRIQDEADSCEIQVFLSPHSYSTYFGSRN